MFRKGKISPSHPIGQRYLEKGARNLERAEGSIISGSPNLAALGSKRLWGQIFILDSAAKPPV